VIGNGCGRALMTPEPAFFLQAPLTDDICVPTVEQVEHVDQPTALGFSAIDVLNRLAGQHTAPLLWIDPKSSSEYELAYGPERGTSKVVVHVRAAEGMILHRYKTPVLGAPEGTDCGPGALEIPVEVTLKSSAGALDDTFSAALSAQVPYRARLSKTFEPGALEGGLTFSELQSFDRERSFWLARLSLDMLLWEGGSSGSLSGQLGAAYVKESKQLRPPPLPATDPGELALWPSAEVCEGPFLSLPSDAKVMGFSARDVLNALEGDRPRELTWSDGSVTELSLTYLDVGDHVCQAIEDGLELDVEVQARTRDGRIDTRLPVRVTAMVEAGSIGEIIISRGGPGEPPLTPRPESGPHGAVEPGADHAVLVDIEMTQKGSADSGSISVREVDRPTPDGDGSYPSTLITTGHWAR
jgi:hypothetical protein